MPPSELSDARRLDDPVLTEVIKNALQAAANEASVTVVRSAISVSVKEGSDSSCAILDDSGQLLAQSSGTFLGHMSSLSMSLKELLRDHPTTVMSPGDSFVMNDPERGGIHANDVAVFMPVFDSAGSVVLFVGSLIHVFDLGGVSAGGLPSQATERYHEGLLLPPVRLMRAGKWNEDVVRIIALNSRGPEAVMGDINALVAGCNLGLRRLAELIDRYGTARFRRIVADLLDYTEALALAGIGRLTQERRTAEFTIDDDGIDPHRSHTVRVSLEPRLGRMLVNFAGSDRQASGPINASRSQVLSGVIFGLRCFLDPALPMNEGVLRVIRVEAPDGTIVNPSPYAAVNARIITVFAVIDAVIRALSDRSGAPVVASSGLNHVYTMSGLGPRGRRWIHMDSDFGGAGATCESDGQSADGAYLFAGRGSAKQVEAIEVGHPHLRYEEVALITDSGGPGRWRGGLGLRKIVRALDDSEVSVRADRVRFPPAGVAGGLAGTGGGWTLRTAAGDQQLRSKQMGVRMNAGDRLSMVTSGGGGYGAPVEREPSRVLADVRAGYVSVEEARDTYLVAIIPGESADDIRVDDSATTAMRGGPPPTKAAS